MSSDGRNKPTQTRVFCGCKAVETGNIKINLMETGSGDMELI
jgi:hypothetical protein